MKIITRAEWGARPPKTTPRKIATPTPELWLHHTASPDGGAARVRAIQNYHMDTRGWNDIAYSFLINGAGLVFEGRGPGIAGGHTKNHNTISHAICVLGHYDQTAPTPASIAAVVELARYGHDKGWWPQKFTGGHRDASGANTSCPGRYLYTKLPAINKQLLEDDMPAPKDWDAADKAVIAKLVVDNSVGALIGKDPNRRSIATSIARIESATVGLDTTSDAELAAAVDELMETLPQRVLDLLKEKL